MDHDEDFIQAIIAHPDNGQLRLIYAAWLWERGDERGEFLRLEAELANLSLKDNQSTPQLKRFRQRMLLLKRLRELRKSLDPDWLAQLDRTVIENCRFPGGFAGFTCPKQWEKLRQTQQSSVRACDGCGKNVYFCHSIEEAQSHAGTGRCVAVDSRLARKPGDLLGLGLI